MDETINIYLCHQCQNVFKLAAPADSAKGVKCPRCGSSRAEAMPSWTPLGFNLDEGTSMWEYECQQCRHVFKLPVPSSPSQEKGIKCPACAGGHIHRLTPTGGEPLYCG